MNPPRKLMLVVRELHLMGYEGLRLAPYLAPSGMYWRAQIVPVKYISPKHGARSIYLSKHSGIPTYTSGNGYNYFELGTVESDTPQQIAEKFIDRFQELAQLGKLDDPEYVQWYAEMLAATEPDGTIYAFADFDVPSDRMPVDFSLDVFVPLPPLSKTSQ
jgi:ADP-ribosyl-[dinitrogen reductase] hydrolase